MIDFHAHLDLYPDPNLVIEEAIQRKMYILSVTTTPSAWPGTYTLAKHYSRIRTSLGLHPQIAHERISELPLFDKYIDETSYVGEIGLDGSPLYSEYWSQQVTVLKHILNTCNRSGGKILSIHSLRAVNEVIEIFDKYPDVGIPVLHWFTGTKEELHRAIDRGFWFSVGPAMLKSKRSKDLVKLIPKNRILTESDGPFAKIKGKSVMPWDVKNAIDDLSEIWGSDYPETKDILLSNFRNIVSLKP